MHLTSIITIVAFSGSVLSAAIPSSKSHKAPSRTTHLQATTFHHSFDLGAKYSKIQAFSFAARLQKLASKQKIIYVDLLELTRCRRDLFAARLRKIVSRQKIIYDGLQRLMRCQRVRFELEVTFEWVARVLCLAQTGWLALEL